MGKIAVFAWGAYFHSGIPRFTVMIICLLILYTVSPIEKVCNYFQTALIGAVIAH